MKVDDEAAAPSGSVLALLNPNVWKLPDTPWLKVRSVFSTVALLVLPVVVASLVPAAHHVATESRRVQNGPNVDARIDKIWVEHPSDRDSPLNLTHLEFSYTTLVGQHEQSQTEVDHLLGDDAVVGARIGIVYDPGAPSKAALPGQPIVDANEDWLVVVSALVFFGFALARVAFVIRRRRWNARS